MKHVYFILLVLAVVGCGPRARDVAPVQNDKICCGMNPSEMVFKSANGREVVSWDEVTAIEVNILAVEGPSHQDGLYRMFNGDQAKMVVRQMKFAWPQQNGTPASLETGVVTIHYVHTNSTLEQTRTLSIQNGRLLEDKNFPDVLYDPGIVLDKKWLEDQQ